MPISEYYGGHGSEVMKSMKEQYGPEHGKEVFYATANEHPSMKPAEDSYYRGEPVHEVTGHAGTIDAGLCGMDAIVEWGKPYGINSSEAGGPPLTPDLHKATGL